MPEKTITASCEIHGHDLSDIPVLNPNGWFGKAWLIELGGSYTPLFLVVEADTVSDAIDELSDNKKYGHQIHVSEDDLGDYPEDDRHLRRLRPGHRPGSRHGPWPGADRTCRSRSATTATDCPKAASTLGSLASRSRVEARAWAAGSVPPPRS